MKKKIFAILYLLTKNSFEQLIDNVYQTHCVLQENVVKVINQGLSIRSWLIGCYIVECEQNGKDRAAYGELLLDEKAIKLKAKGLKGFSIRALRNCRTFYMEYPQIRQTVSKY